MVKLLDSLNQNNMYIKERIEQIKKTGFGNDKTGETKKSSRKAGR